MCLQCPDDAHASAVPAVRRADPHAGSVLQCMWCAPLRPGTVARLRHARRRVLRRRGPHFLLWFRINGVPTFPLGLMGGLVLAYRSHDINTKLGRESLFVVTAILCVLATIVGLLLR